VSSAQPKAGIEHFGLMGYGHKIAIMIPWDRADVGLVAPTRFGQFFQTSRGGSIFVGFSGV
jgi:hypothetical protein